MSKNRRKSDMTDSAKPAILKAVAECKDDNLRAVLLLMLAVLEEIGSKIDAVMSDEKTIREMVLNGHSAVHDSDHEWISQCRDNRVDEICAWAREKMHREEVEASSKRRVSEGIAEKIFIAVGSILTTWLVLGMMKSLGL
jgi:hypothetical protein